MSNVQRPMSGVQVETLFPGLSGCSNHLSQTDVGLWTLDFGLWTLDIELEGMVPKGGLVESDSYNLCHMNYLRDKCCSRKTCDLSL
jgi:hypothetical protein